MKTKYWILLFTGMFALCLGLGLFLLMPGTEAGFAEITSQGKVIKTVDLRMDQEFTVTTPDGGHNVVTVAGGKIGVTEANCPDHYCMARGMISKGTQIVCLPNRLVITLVAQTEIDGIAG